MPTVCPAPARRAAFVGARPILATSLALTLSVGSVLWSAPGDLDCRFGPGPDMVPGITDVPEALNVVLYMTINPDETISWVSRGPLGSGIFRVGRSLVNGDLDTSFGGGLGYVETDLTAIDATLAGAQIFGWTQDASGNFVGTGTRPGGAIGSQTADETDVLVLRFLTTGALDSSFDGDGVVSFEFEGATQLYGDDRTVSSGADVHVQSDSHILVAGSATTDSQGLQFSLGAIARLTPTGALDNTFGDEDGTADGKRLLDIGDPSPSASRQLTVRHLALDSSGLILVSGLTRNNDTFVFRLHNGTPMQSDGDKDTSFDTDGYVVHDLSTVAGATGMFTSDNPRALFGLPGQQILIAGNGNTDIGQVPLLARLTSSGALDATFDGDGVARFAYFPGVQQSASVIIPFGTQYIFAGTVNPPGDSFNWAHARVNADGSLDTTYADGGIRFHDPTVGAGVTAAAITPDNQVVLSGVRGGPRFAKYLAGSEVESTTLSILSDLPDPSSAGQAVTVSLELTGNGGGGGARGGADFDGDILVSHGGASCIAPIAAGNAGDPLQTNCQITLTQAGTEPLLATYRPAGMAYCSSSDTEAHTVLALGTTTTIQNTTPTTATVGVPFDVDFEVLEAARGTIGGVVTVSDGVDQCVVSATSGTCSLTLNTPGNRTLIATFGGNSSYSGSQSAGYGVQVQNPPPSVTITGESADPTVVGETFQVQFSVAATTRGTVPTGSVTVGDGVDSCNGTLTGGSGSCNLALTTPGARSLVAGYSGDALYPSANSNGEAHQVNPAATTTTITSDSPDPSLVNGSVTVAWNVAVDAPGAGTPTGQVTVTATGQGASCSAAVAAGQCSLALTAVGATTLTATYAGDAAFSGSAGNAGHTVQRSTSTTTITSDTPDPSTVTETVTVSVTVGGTTTSPTGSVTVDDGLGAQCVAALVAGGGSCDLVPSAAGALTLTANYGGDALTEPSSDTEAHGVNVAGTSLDLFLLSSPPLRPDSDVDFGVDLTIEARGGPVPTGLVTLDAGNGVTCSTPIEVGSCALVFPTPGFYEVQASYEGDDNFDPAFAAAVEVEISSIVAVPATRGTWILAIVLAVLGSAWLRSR